MTPRQPITFRVGLRYCYAAVCIETETWWVNWQEYGAHTKPIVEGPMSRARANWRVNTLNVEWRKK